MPGARRASCSRWPQPGGTREAADAHDAGPGGGHHEHQVVRPGVAEKLCEAIATRRVYGIPIGRPRGAADAHDAGSGVSVGSKKSQSEAL